MPARTNDTASDLNEVPVVGEIFSFYLFVSENYYLHQGHAICLARIDELPRYGSGEGEIRIYSQCGTFSIKGTNKVDGIAYRHWDFVATDNKKYWAFLKAVRGNKPSPSSA